MAFAISRAFHLPLDVSHILETFIQPAEYAAFDLKYGHGMIYQRKSLYEKACGCVSNLSPVTPGYLEFTTYVDFCHLKVGMEII